MESCGSFVCGPNLSRESHHIRILYSVHFLHASGKYNLDIVWHWITSTLESVCLSIPMVHSMLGHFVPLLFNSPQEAGFVAVLYSAQCPESMKQNRDLFPYGGDVRMTYRSVLLAWKCE